MLIFSQHNLKHLSMVPKGMLLIPPMKLETPLWKRDWSFNYSYLSNNFKTFCCIPGRWRLDLVDRAESWWRIR